MCFISYKNRKLKVKLWWVGACKRKNRAFFAPFILLLFYYRFKHLCFILMYSVLNRLSEYIYFYKSKNMIVCYYHVTYEFQNESTLYSLPEYQGTLSQSRPHIWSLSDSNLIRIHHHLVRKQTLNHLCQTGWVFIYKLSGCGFESHCCHKK